MARTKRGSGKPNHRSAPYETGRPQKKGRGGGQNNNGSGRGRNASNSNGRGRGGRPVSRRGGRGGRGGRGNRNSHKPRTAEELDREMDSYWGKSEEHATKKLDGDMDDYWKDKDAATNESETESKTNEAHQSDAAFASTEGDDASK